MIKQKMAKITEISQTMFTSIMIILLLIFISIEAIKVHAQTPGRLPQNEVEALKEVTTQLGKKDWNFEVDPCGNDTSWVTPIPIDKPLYNNTLFCNCSFPAGECHVESIFLTAQDLAGVLPRAIVKLPYLKKLDLTRNYLSGNIPSEWATSKLEFLYLTGNLLSGPLPDWIKNGDTRADIDLSRNNFTESSLPIACRDSLNLYRSTSGGNDSKPAECLKNFACSKDRYSLHINCGGGATTVGGIAYEADEESGAAARYVPNRETWEMSNSGHFWDKNRSSSDYIAQNVSTLTMDNSELYMRARLSPLSLVYYVRCLGNGNYNVQLHFAEIIFGHNGSYRSLGKRIFDVYIQDRRVLKDFDIVKEAQGVDKVVIQHFKAAVKDGALEIRFQWAGKGTTAVPRRGIYGPLISAIDVESDFKPPISSEEKRKKFIVAGAVGFPLLLIIVIVGIIWWKGYLGGREVQDRELLGLDLQTGVFTFRQIKAATNNLDPANKIGEGGFGAVYKGTLSDGTIIAVKQLSSKSKQGNREFLNEVGMISALQHPNLVRLYGCCVERNQLLLVYEYMENNSLSNVLFEESGLNLDWPTRQRICIGIAKGLAFMDEESPLKIVHRDIKTTNVLLDKNLIPKISDFSLAKLDEEENTHISTRVAGTIGYMAPEYALWGYLTFKADVYSFGIVALEIAVGKNNMKFRPDENCFCLQDKAIVLQQKGDLVELVDPRLGSKFNKAEAVRMIKVALLCTNTSPALRPTMSEVVRMLEGRAAIPEFIMGPSIYGINSSPNQFDQSSVQSASEIRSFAHSSGTSFMGS